MNRYRGYATGREAVLGWAAVTSVVVTYEMFAPEGQLLSEGIDRALVRYPVLTRLVVGLVAAHLLNLIPPRIDPLHRLATARVRPNLQWVKSRSRAHSGRVWVLRG